jgi:hypothetical protein
MEKSLFSNLKKKNHINTYIAKKLIEVKLKILDELKKYK